jgi:hypothetical protein
MIYLSLCVTCCQCSEVWHLLIVILQDMIAFSCCVYDGGDEEKKEMDAAREIGWRGKFTKRGRVIRPGVIRMNGKCPLTPLEVCQYLITEGRATVVVDIFSLKQIHLGLQQNLS